MPADQIESWMEDRRGALVGDVLAKKLGWKVGDKVTLRGTIYPGDWEFNISGIYTATRKSVDRSTFWFHWDYLNDVAAAARARIRSAGSPRASTTRRGRPTSRRRSTRCSTSATSRR